MMSNSNWWVSFVNDQAVETIRRVVDWRDDSLTERFGEGADAFLAGAGFDVLFLEFAVGLEDDQLHLERQVVLQIGADLLIGAFRVAGNPFEVRLDFRIKVNFEVVGRVDLPLEGVVVNVVLAEVGHERGLRGRALRGADDGRRDEQGHDWRP
jgi:hypothetical protein